MLVHCCLYGGKAFSWDINQSRGSFLYGLFSKVLEIISKDINKHWTFVGFDSVDKNIGIPVLSEMKLKTL